MFVVLTTVPIDPERRDEATDRIDALAETSRSEEGTERYWATTDLGDPNLVRFVELYEDADAVEAHHESDAYRAFVESLPDVVDGEIETLQFEADDPHEVAFTADDAVASLDSE